MACRSDRIIAYPRFLLYVPNRIMKGELTNSSARKSIRENCIIIQLTFYKRDEPYKVISVITLPRDILVEPSQFFVLFFICPVPNNTCKS